MTTPARPSASVKGVAEPAAFHPERLVAVLGRFKVRYVLAGTVAARLQGFPWMTSVAELVPAVDPQNFEALVSALKHVNARIYTDGTPDGLPFELSADALTGAERWSFVTSCGRVDLTFRPRGVDGFGALSERAIRFTLHSDAILVASLDDLLRMREAVGGMQDKYEIAVLRELVKRQL
ncbi:MAG TPA: hypothetical protein VJR92_06910 [Gemmatimonadaceae bacterium]|nr:hypothetical protein [Gemmatimonadaceae bacterium]